MVQGIQCPAGAAQDSLAQTETRKKHGGGGGGAARGVRGEWQVGGVCLQGMKPGAGAGKLLPLT